MKLVHINLLLLLTLLIVYVINGVTTQQKQNNLIKDNIEIKTEIQNQKKAIEKLIKNQNILLKNEDMISIIENQKSVIDKLNKINLKFKNSRINSVKIRKPITKKIVKTKTKTNIKKITPKEQFKKLHFIGTIEKDKKLSAMVYLNDPNKVKFLDTKKYIFKIWQVIEIEKDKIIFQNSKTKIFFIKKKDKK